MFTLRIEVLSGTGAGRVFEPEREVVCIGRAPSNDLQLDEPHLSGEHARILIRQRDVVLEDLRSTNGTSLLRDGTRRRLREPATMTVELQSDDVIELGGDGEESTSLR